MGWLLVLIISVSDGVFHRVMVPVDSLEECKKEGVARLSSFAPGPVEHRFVCLDKEKLQDLGASRK